MNASFILNEQDVNLLLNKGLEYAKSKGFVITLAVTDAGGYLLGLLRMDGCRPMSSLIAEQKARTAALSGKETKVLEDMINNGRGAFLSAPLEGCMEGGIPILKDGQVVGAVGVSGMAKDQDREIAQVAIAALT